jgi:hypothetical protein
MFDKSAIDLSVLLSQLAERKTYGIKSVAIFNGQSLKDIKVNSNIDYTLSLWEITGDSSLYISSERHK